MIARKLGILLLLVALPSAPPVARSAVPARLDIRARIALARVRRGEAPAALRARGEAVDDAGELEVFVRGDVTRERLEAAGAHVRTALPGLFTASIPAGAIDRVAALDGVTAIRGGVVCRPELDASVPTTGAQYLRGAGPGFAGLNGSGVIVGIVDSGVDYQHGDFRDSTGATRLLDIWDQTASGVGPPGMPYPYGIECSPAEIEAGTCSQRDSLEHGTHALGVSAGDGSQTGGGRPPYTYAGMAPLADLVVVKTDFSTPEVIDGVHYVFDKATARGENAVVSLSLGTQYGSHDGQSEFEQGLSALLGPGRIVVKSAGNDRGKAIHAEVHATTAGAPVTLSVANSAKTRYFGVDGYYNASERIRVKLRTPNGTIIGPINLNTENAAWPGQSTGNGTVYMSHDSLDAARKEVYFEVSVDASNQTANGTWTITLIADQLGPANGEVDLWRFLASTGLTADFVTGNLPTQELISEPGNAADVITAGAWVTKTSWTGCNGVAGTYSGTPAAGNLAPFSSPGPTRDGRQKPDLTAPGSAVGAATSFDITQTCPAPPAVSELLNDGGNHRVLQGTSISAPYVAGAVALLLQKRGALAPQEVIAYLTGHARVDAFTGAVPNRNWGYGKLAMGDLVDPAARVVSPSGGGAYDLGQAVQLIWTATDSLGSVTAVDLRLSRTGPDGPFEDIALGIPNSGHYDWTVTGPPTGPTSAYLQVGAHDTNGNVGTDLNDAGFKIGGVLAVDAGAGTEFAIRRISPNPSAGSTAVEFSVARRSRVRLTVRDLMGRTLYVLANGEMPAGTHRATWNGLQGRDPAPSGIYFIDYVTPAGRYVRRMVFAR